MRGIYNKIYMFSGKSSKINLVQGDNEEFTPRSKHSYFGKEINGIII